MKKLYALALLLLFVGLACAQSAGPTPTPTPPNAGDQLLTMGANVIFAQATENAVHNIQTATGYVVIQTEAYHTNVANITNTAQAIYFAEATAEQDRQNSIATAEQDRRNIEGTQAAILGTQSAEAAIATNDQYRRDQIATAEQGRKNDDATAQAGATATAGIYTMTAVPPADTNTAIAMAQGIAIASNEVELSNLEVQKARDTNRISWLWPIIVSGALVLILAGWVWAISQIQPVKDGHGNILMVFWKNRKSFTPRLMPKPVYNLLEDKAEDLADPQEQAEVTKRAQVTDMLEAMPEKPTDPAMDLIDKYLGAQSQKKLPVIEITTPDQVGRDILNELEGQVIEEGDQ